MSAHDITKLLNRILPSGPSQACLPVPLQGLLAVVDCTFQRPLSVFSAIDATQQFTAATCLLLNVPSPSPKTATVRDYQPPTLQLRRHTPVARSCHHHTTPSGRIHILSFAP
ncbi:hypothetical protein LZ32DRAFT_430994 [Colletotrichum eremochloae]|nr:hypothetical protein LZ32DRAFT_430994 [Colletotrichum eremochloae]